MRISIEIDDRLMKDAIAFAGLKTRREVVDLALRTLLRLTQQQKIRNFRGRLVWQGDLDEMRTDD